MVLVAFSLPTATHPRLSIRHLTTRAWTFGPGLARMNVGCGNQYCPSAKNRH